MEPAAWRDPDVDIESKELAPGDAKNERRLSETLVEVRRPTPVSTEISEEVKLELSMVVEVGFASMIEMYFANDD